MFSVVGPRFSPNFVSYNARYILRCFAFRECSLQQRLDAPWNPSSSIAAEKCHILVFIGLGFFFSCREVSFLRSNSWREALPWLDKTSDSSDFELTEVWLRHLFLPLHYCWVFSQQHEVFISVSHVVTAASFTWPQHLLKLPLWNTSHK